MLGTTTTMVKSKTLPPFDGSNIEETRADPVPLVIISPLMHMVTVSSWLS